MKLRLQSNSLRLRLKRAEVAQLAAGDLVEEKIIFGPGQALCYRLEAMPNIKTPRAIFRNSNVTVEIPAEMATTWASSDQVGIEEVQDAGAGIQLRILIEKDFACLNGPMEQNVDTFPNPNAGTSC